MSFEDVPQGSRHHPPLVRVCLTAPGGRSDGTTRLMVTLSADMLATLGWIPQETRIGIRVGRGENFGRVQLYTCPNGAIFEKLPRSTQGALVRLRPGADLEVVSASSQPAAAVVAEGELHIALPWPDLAQAVAAAQEAA